MKIIWSTSKNFLFSMVILIVIAALASSGVGTAAPSAPVSSATSGGPDQFGYTFKDSNDVGGPTYSWFDISSTGTPLSSLIYNDYGIYSGPLPIGFSFPFYDNTYTEVFWNLAGYLSFGEGMGHPHYYPLPNGYPPNNEFALFGNDNSFVFWMWPTVYQMVANPTRFILQVDSPSGSMSFQAVLFPNGDMIALYKIVDGDTQFVGIENTDGSDGLSYGQPLANNLAIRYYYPVGIRFKPNSAEGFGRPGTQVTIPVKVTNNTPNATAIQFSSQSGKWPITITPATTAVLPVRTSTNLTIKVSVPLTATPGEYSAHQILATALNSPGFTQMLPITATATSFDLAYIPVKNIVSPDIAYLAKFDPATRSLVGRVDLVPFGCNRPHKVAIPPDGNIVWTSCIGSNQVILTSTRTDQVLKVVNGVPSPTTIAFSQDGLYALVGSQGTNLVVVIDRKTYALSYFLLDGTGTSVAAHPYLPIIYAISKSNSLLWEINTDTLSVVGTMDTTLDTSEDIVVANNGLRVFTSDYKNSPTGFGQAFISIFDLVTEVVTNYGQNSYSSITDLLPRLDDQELFFSLDYWVYFMDPQTGELTDSVLPDTTTYPTFNALGLNCDGTELYLVSEGGYYNDTAYHVFVMDVFSRTVTTRLRMFDTDFDGHHDPGASDFALCPQPDSRLKVSVSPAVRTADPGTSVEFPITITNMSPSPITDTFTILAMPNYSWPVSLSTTITDPLQWNESTTVTLTMEVPEEAVRGFNLVHLTVAHTSLPENKRTTAISVMIPSTFLPLISR